MFNFCYQFLDLCDVKNYFMFTFIGKLDMICVSSFALQVRKLCGSKRNLMI